MAEKVQMKMKTVERETCTGESKKVRSLEMQLVYFKGSNVLIANEDLAYARELNFFFLKSHKVIGM